MNYAETCATASTPRTAPMDREPSRTWSFLMTLMVLVLLLWSLAETRAYRDRPAVLDVSPVSTLQRSVAPAAPVVDEAVAARQRMEALRLRSRLVA